jgi:exopolysaccharide biosynthesis polyprenyl glycosylphosphotransferase
MDAPTNNSPIVLRRVELAALFLVDVVMLIVAFVFYYMARFRWGWLNPGSEPASPFVAMFLMSGFWIIVFMFSGLYKEKFAPSRFDELSLLVKVVTVGSLVVFFAMFSNALEAGSARPNLLVYWATILGSVGSGRMVVRSIQQVLLTRGYGARKALIVGWTDRVQALFEEVARYPAAGLKIVGAIQLRTDDELVPVPAGGIPEVGAGGDGSATLVDDVLISQDLQSDDLRSVHALPRLIEELAVQDVLIVLAKDDERHLSEVLRVVDGRPVVLKLIPDFYHMLGGMARTEQIYGLPMIEVNPEPMKTWERSVKRLLDIVVSTLVLFIGSPLWLAVTIAVRMESHGASIFRQERVGSNGRLFTMFKFRTMKNDAESDTGPVWATEDDPRYTKLGGWLRRTRIDEVPQLINVLIGDMSLVGPRPERQFFVDQLVKEIPLYKRRLRVKPGITGIAQVKWKYDESVEDVRQKVKYDLFYISNMSFGMDLKILFATVRTMLSGRGH